MLSPDAEATVVAQIRAQLAACGAPLLGDTLYRHAVWCLDGSTIPGQWACCSDAAQHGHVGPAGEVLESEDRAQSAGGGDASGRLPRAAKAPASVCCGARADEACTKAGERTGVAGAHSYEEGGLRGQRPTQAAVCASSCRTCSADACCCSFKLHKETELPPRRPVAIGLQAWRLEIRDSQGLFGEPGTAVFEASQPWWRDA